MEQKEKYTFEELCSNLEISMSAFSRESKVDEGTIARIRKGHIARRSTVNKLLRVFSEIYDIKLSLDNVTGITLQGLAEKAENAPVPTPLVRTPKAVIETTPKRVYARKEKATDLPPDCILALDFSRNHNVKRETFRDHMLIGKGPGTVPGEETYPTLGVKDHVDYSERQKPNRPNEKEKYLTQQQQQQALEFWQRHGVTFAQCTDSACYCHETLQKDI
jgi:hypothetical protein